MNHLEVDDLSNDSQTILELKIPNRRQIFFEGSDDNDLDDEIKNLLLADKFHFKKGMCNKAKLFLH